MIKDQMHAKKKSDEIKDLQGILEELKTRKRFYNVKETQEESWWILRIIRSRNENHHHNPHR